MTTATKSITTADALDALLGYRGSIQGTPLERALDEQRSAIWEAQTIVDLAVGALENHFGRDWPASVPQFPLALRRVSRMLGTVTGELEGVTLEDRALAIARAEEAEQGGAA